MSHERDSYVSPSFARQPAGLCRACLKTWPAGHAPVDEQRCPSCHLPTLRFHPELFELEIAHIDCDAFYASVEKRDNPSLRDKPVIVGHAGGRGVVTTACYIARKYGPRSAMPMFKALRLCPQAIVIPPDMTKYKAVSRQIRDFMLEMTAVIEPLSLDEAYLDLSRSVRRSPQVPAVQLAALAQKVKSEIGISISIGLAANKFLAKLASDLEKPRGYSIIGHGDARAVLAPMSVSRIHGVGPTMVRQLEAANIQTIGQLQRLSDHELLTMFGKFGRRLADFVRGEDPRAVSTNRLSKSLSAETTFSQDKQSAEDIFAAADKLCMRVAARLRAAEISGGTLIVKLKTADFRTLTRSRKLSNPTQRADVLSENARQIIREECDGRWFRLIGIGVSDMASAVDADPPDLFDETI
ncbi:MAG: DNA polymerase IV [Hyphomicrobiaceae bacterium]